MPTLDGKLCVPKGRPHRAAAGEGNVAATRAYVDEAPHDWSRRMVHADAVQDAGDDREAAFQRSMGDWLKWHADNGTAPNDPYPAHGTVDYIHRDMPWSVRDLPSYLPAGVNVTKIDRASWWPRPEGFDHVAMGRFGRLVWPTARGMEEGFRQAFIPPESKQMARRYAQKPATSESFIAALKDMRTKKQAARREVAHAVATQAGIVPHTFHDAIHDRVDGRATPSVVHHYPNAPSAQTARYSAAWFGLITGLEGVAVFFPDPKGPDFLYEFHAQGSGEVLRQRLDRAGIGDRVLMPKRGGFTVMVLDQGGTMGDRVRRYAGGNVTAMRGRAERMGGDNPVQARDEYRKLIKGYEGAAQKARVHGGLRRYAIRDSQGEPDGRGE